MARIGQAARTGDHGLPASASSCASTSSCAAVDFSGFVVSFDGIGWSDPVPVDEPRGCPTRSPALDLDVRRSGPVRCRAGQDSRVVGQQQVDPGHALTDVSCPTDDFCIAVDDIGLALTFDAGQLVGPESIDVGGLRDSRPSPVPRPGSAQPSTSTTGHCSTTGDAGPCHRSSIPVAWASLPCSVPSGEVLHRRRPRRQGDHVATTGGQNPVEVDSSFFGFQTISCSSKTFCVAALAFRSIYTYDGHSWSGPLDISAAGRRAALGFLSQRRPVRGR